MGLHEVLYAAFTNGVRATAIQVYCEFVEICNWTQVRLPQPFYFVMSVRDTLGVALRPWLHVKKKQRNKTYSEIFRKCCVFNKLSRLKPVA